MPDLPPDLRRWLADQPDADALAGAWAAAEPAPAPDLAAARARLDARLDALAVSQNPPPTGRSLRSPLGRLSPFKGDSQIATERSDGRSDGGCDEGFSPAADRQPVRPARTARRWALAAALVATLVVGVWRLVPVTAEAGTSVAHVDLPDGTDVTLGPGSRLAWRRGFGQRHVTLAGDAFFAVAHDAARPFTVDAGPSRVTVLGTRFAVRAWDDASEASVVVEEGRVRVADAADGRAVEIGPGRRAVVVPGGRPVVSAADVAAATAWQRAAFAVYDAPLGAVAVQVQRMFGTPIRLAPGVDPTERVTAILPRADDASAVVEDLAASLGYRVRLRDGGFDLIP